MHANLFRESVKFVIHETKQFVESSRFSRIFIFKIDFKMLKENKFVSANRKEQIMLAFVCSFYEIPSIPYFINIMEISL